MLPPRAVAALGALSYRDEPVFVEKRPPAGMAPRRRVSTPVPIADARKAATSRQQSDVPASTTSFPHTTLRDTWATWHYALRRDLLL